jgi:hypothetical protein
MAGNVELLERTRPPAKDNDEYRAFSFGRIGIRPQLTLLFTKASGEVEGFPYADFRGIWTRDRNAGFTMTFGNRIITVEGQNLKQLFEYICNHRAAEVVLCDPHSAMALEENATVVWAIT